MEEHTRRAYAGGSIYGRRGEASASSQATTRARNASGSGRGGGSPSGASLDRGEGSGGAQRSGLRGSGGASGGRHLTSRHHTGRGTRGRDSTLHTCADRQGGHWHHGSHAPSRRPWCWGTCSQPLPHRPPPWARGQAGQRSSARALADPTRRSAGGGRRCPHRQRRPPGGARGWRGGGTHMQGADDGDFRVSGRPRPWRCRRRRWSRRRSVCLTSLRCVRTPLTVASRRHYLRSLDGQQGTHIYK